MLGYRDWPDYDAEVKMIRRGAAIMPFVDGISADAVNEGLIGQYLYTGGQPDPDLIIRTAGEMRLSNFLIWQSAYAEYYFTQTYWPDFDREELRRALASYAQRVRRFGQVLSNVDVSGGEG